MVGKLLYRQIHPNFVLGDIVTSQAFKPTKNNKRLSVYDGSMIGAKTAWERHTRSELRSAGVMAIAEVECKSQSLTVIPDPAPYKEHMVVDFDDLSQRTIKNAARSLAADANKRGWCYRPIAVGPTERLDN